MKCSRPTQVRADSCLLSTGLGIHSSSPRTALSRDAGKRGSGLTFAHSRPGTKSYSKGRLSEEPEPTGTPHGWGAAGETPRFLRCGYLRSQRKRLRRAQTQGAGPRGDGPLAPSTELLARHAHRPPPSISLLHSTAWSDAPRSPSPLPRNQRLPGPLPQTPNSPSSHNPPSLLHIAPNPNPPPKCPSSMTSLCPLHHHPLPRLTSTRL